jgi:hypothetical protein
MFLKQKVTDFQIPYNYDLNNVVIMNYIIFRLEYSVFYPYELTDLPVYFSLEK